MNALNNTKEVDLSSGNLFLHNNHSAILKAVALHLYYKLSLNIFLNFIPLILGVISLKIEVARRHKHNISNKDMSNKDSC